MRMPKSAPQNRKIPPTGPHILEVMILLSSSQGAETSAWGSAFASLAKGQDPRSRKTCAPLYTSIPLCTVPQTWLVVDLAVVSILLLFPRGPLIGPTSAFSCLEWHIPCRLSTFAQQACKYKRNATFCLSSRATHTKQTLLFSLDFEVGSLREKQDTCTDMSATSLSSRAVHISYPGRSHAFKVPELLQTFDGDPCRTVNALTESEPMMTPAENFDTCPLPVVSQEALQPDHNQLRSFIETNSHELIHMCTWVCILAEWDWLLIQSVFMWVTSA